MKKKLTLLLTLAMLLGLAACGNKTDTSTGANPSKETEKETGAVESVVGEVVEAIEEAVLPQKGDMTDKMYFAKDISFTSATPLEFFDWDAGGATYFWKDESHHGVTEFTKGDGHIASLYTPLKTPEGEYQGIIHSEKEGGYIELSFQTEAKDGEKYEIRVTSEAYDSTYIPDEEYVKLFLQLVQNLLDSGVVTDAKMSNIQYDLSVPVGTSILTSPDAIEAE